MDVISLLVTLLLIGLVFWAVRLIGAALSIPAPILTVINVLLVIVLVLYLLRALGLWSGGPVIQIR